MNAFHTLNTEYLKPSRTIETILVSNNYTQNVLYVYNYEGTHFRLFTNLLELAKFFELGTEPKYDFMEEEDLDLFLEEYLEGIN